MCFVLLQVGIAAVQIAKFLGLKVIGTAGSTEGMALAKKNGADAVFNHREAGYLDSIRVRKGRHRSATKRASSTASG